MFENAMYIFTSLEILSKLMYENLVQVRKIKKFENPLFFKYMSKCHKNIEKQQIFRRKYSNS